MFNITPENLHIYVFAILGILVICFAVQFYIKSNLDAEIFSLKKKIKKLHHDQQVMYLHIKKKEQIERLQQQKMQRDEEEQQQQQQREKSEELEENDNDSYADPIALR
jgi:predicted Holliday junction resolvase-like endonuclease